MPDALTKDTEKESGGHAFLFKEAVLSGFYSSQGVRGLPAGDMSKDHWGFSPRPPGSYIGLDYVQTFTASSAINKILPEWFPMATLDLHPRVVYDPMEKEHGLDPYKFAPQDFWFRFTPGNVDRLQLRVGEFVIPYGMNPVMAPRQTGILPVEAIDLGLKWDWGIDLKGPIGAFDWELAATTGTGEGLNMPRLFDDKDHQSYLVTGRMGSPTYWDFQNGLSFLYGDLPTIMGPTIIDKHAISRWRLAYDTFYKYGTYLMVGAQASFGQDGFTDDEKFVRPTMGKTADVLGYQIWADWVVPMHQNLRLQAQFASIYRDVGTPGAHDTAAVLQAGYSWTTAISTVLSFRKELNTSMGELNDGIYLTFIYYSR